MTVGVREKEKDGENKTEEGKSTVKKKSQQGWFTSATRHKNTALLAFRHLEDMVSVSQISVFEISAAM